MEKIWLRIRQSYREFWIPDNINSLATSLGLFLLAVYVQKIADSYVGRIKSVAVGDLLLNYLPNLDIDRAIVWGALFFTFVAIFIVFYKF